MTYLQPTSQSSCNFCTKQANFLLLILCSKAINSFNMKFLIALAIFALIAVAAAVVAPVVPAGLPAIPAGVVPVGYAGGPAAVIAPGVVREYHGAPLIHGYYSGLLG